MGDRFWIRVLQAREAGLRHCLRGGFGAPRGAGVFSGLEERTSQLRALSEMEKQKTMRAQMEELFFLGGFSVPEPPSASPNPKFPRALWWMLCFFGACFLLDP